MNNMKVQLIFLLKVKIVIFPTLENTEKHRYKIPVIASPVIKPGPYKVFITGFFCEQFDFCNKNDEMIYNRFIHLFFTCIPPPSPLSFLPLND